VRGRDAWFKEIGGTASLPKILVGMCAGDQEACAIERAIFIDLLKIITEVRK
jgi:hypothetical protein